LFRNRAESLVAEATEYAIMAVLQKLGTEYVEFYAGIAGKQLAAAKAAGC
jgi:hypothetical protein